MQLPAAFILKRLPLLIAEKADPKNKTPTTSDIQTSVILALRNSEKYEQFLLYDGIASLAIRYRTLRILNVLGKVVATSKIPPQITKKSIETMTLPKNSENSCWCDALMVTLQYSLQLGLYIVHQEKIYELLEDSPKNYITPFNTNVFLTELNWLQTQKDAAILEVALKSDCRNRAYINDKTDAQKLLAQLTEKALSASDLSITSIAAIMNAYYEGPMADPKSFTNTKTGKITNFNGMDDARSFIYVLIRSLRGGYDLLPIFRTRSSNPKRNQLTQLYHNSMDFMVEDSIGVYLKGVNKEGYMEAWNVEDVKDVKTKDLNGLMTEIAKSVTSIQYTASGIQRQVELVNLPIMFPVVLTGRQHLFKTGKDINRLDFRYNLDSADSALTITNIFNDRVSYTLRCIIIRTNLHWRTVLKLRNDNSNTWYMYDDMIGKWNTDKKVVQSCCNEIQTHSVFIYEQQQI